MQKGDILISKGGYNCTLVSFYKVVDITKSGLSAKIQEIGSTIVSHDGYGQHGYVVPNDTEVKDKIFTRKIGKTFLGYNYVRINDYRYAYPWDGKQVWFDICD